MDYVIQPGDTLSSLGQKFGIDYNQIARDNNIPNPNMIGAGQHLNINVPGSQPQNSTPPLSTTQQLINQISQSIKPAQAFDQTLPYNTYAAPQEAVLNQIYSQQALPQFQQQTLNPFNEQYANNAAAYGTNLMGNGQQNYTKALYGVQTPFNNQWDQAKTAYENMIRQGYNQQLTNFYNQPIANFDPSKLTI